MTQILSIPFVGQVMFLKNLIKIKNTLAFRLTLWYAGIFTVSSLAIFIALYFLLASAIQDRTDNSLIEETNEFSLILASAGLEKIMPFFRLEANMEGKDKIFFRLLKSNGAEVASSDMKFWKGISAKKNSLEQLTDGAKHFFETQMLPEQQYAVRIIYRVVDSGLILQVGKSLENDTRFMENLRYIFSTTFILLMLVASFVGWFMARRALHGVEEITQTAIEISRGSLDKRVPIKGRGEELDRLAFTFNNMIDRIQILIKDMGEMTDNIAHDLRSPITKIRGIAELTLTTGKTLDEYKAMASNTIEESDRLIGMINTMLDISEFEAGGGKLELEKIDISAMMQNACELFRPVADNKKITLITDLRPDCFLWGDLQSIQRMVANLLDNALKYTPRGGVVEVTINLNNEKIIFSIIDDGIGISRDELPHIFKRFYRCDRSRSEPGDGLGLCLAQAIAKVHDGHITVTSELEKGSIFSVALSVAAASR